MAARKIILAAMILAAAVPATAAVVGRSLARGFGNTDLAAIAPVVDAVLAGDAAGTARPWQSPNGTGGKVHLLSGGAKAGGKCGRVRITSVKAGVESTGYRFTYCRDGAGRWRVAG